VFFLLTVVALKKNLILLVHSLNFERSILKRQFEGTFFEWKQALLGHVLGTVVPEGRN